MSASHDVDASPSTGEAAVDLSIVIPSYETADALAACLASIEQALARPDAPVCEVIVVDNGSRDDSLARAAASPLAPRRLAFVRNRGFAAAVNAGLALRRGRHALLLNSDARIDPDALARGVRLLDADTRIGLAGARLRHPDGRPQRSVHAIPGPLSELLPEWLWGPLRPAGVEIRRRPGRARSGPDRPAAGGEGMPRDVEAVRGAVLFLSGAWLERVGRFDEGYFFFLEETDYCDRMRASGARVVIDERLGAEHGLGLSSKRRAPLATRIEFQRSLHRFLTRRYGRATARALRVWRALRNAVAALGLTIGGLASAPLRLRAAERRALLVWHLRGCPDEPGLAEALRSGDRSAVKRRAAARERPAGSERRAGAT